MKQLLRATLQTLHLDLTRNLKYDRLTDKILKTVLRENSNCIDVGCHKGEVIQSILKKSPKGVHYAFEPIPELYQKLVEQFGEKIKVFPYALSDIEEKTTFNLVKNAPAYSGLKQRSYDVEKPEIEVIDVETKRLDDLLPENHRVDLIKIDVEGGELGVLQGALNMLKRDKPVVIFEFGIGASDHYGVMPEDIYQILTEQSGLYIFTLKNFVNGKAPLTLAELEDAYQTNREYYFVAASGILKK